MAAAAAAADGALLDAAARWRGVAAAVDGTSAVWAHGRAALAAAAGRRRRRRPPADLEQARRRRCPTRPRAGWPCCSTGSRAVVDALQGDFDAATRRLAGLAATTVPADPLASDRWDELAVTVVAARPATTRPPS